MILFIRNMFVAAISVLLVFHWIQIGTAAVNEPLGEPSAIVNGLKINLEVEKVTSNNSGKSEFSLIITLKNESAKNITLISNRWEIGENLLIKIFRLPECKAMDIPPILEDVDYSVGIKASELKPGEEIKKTLTKSEGVFFMPPLFQWLEPGFYILYVIYKPYEDGIEKDKSVLARQWQGRVTSNPILVQVGRL